MKTVLYFGREGCARSSAAEQFLRVAFNEVHAFYSAGVGHRFETDFNNISFDVILSFRSHYILRETLISRARLALNFHPGPPEWPGIGCLNYALYVDAPYYGVTCHHIAPVIDSGPIVDVERFPIFEKDSVETLLERSHVASLNQFFRVAARVAQGEPLPALDERWARPALTKRDLNALFVIPDGAEDDELRRRRRAIRYLDYRPYRIINGERVDDDGE